MENTVHNTVVIAVANNAEAAEAPIADESSLLLIQDAWFTPLNGASIRMLPVDPETVGTVIKVGEFLISLFGKSNQDWTARFDNIDSKLEDILKKLDDIALMLQRLGVMLEILPTRIAENNMKGILQSSLEFFPESGKAGNTQLAINFAIRVNESVKVAMNAGSQSYQTVGLAYRFIVEMLELGKASPETKWRIAASYFDYFDGAIDVSQMGSLASRLSEKASNLQSLSKAFRYEEFDAYPSIYFQWPVGGGLYEVYRYTEVVGLSPTSPPTRRSKEEAFCKGSQEQVQSKLGQIPGGYSLANVQSKAEADVVWVNESNILYGRLLEVAQDRYGTYLLYEKTEKEVQLLQAAVDIAYEFRSLAANQKTKWPKVES